MSRIMIVSMLLAFFDMEIAFGEQFDQEMAAALSETRSQGPLITDNPKDARPYLESVDMENSENFEETPIFIPPAAAAAAVPLIVKVVEHGTKLAQGYNALGGGPGPVSGMIKAGKQVVSKTKEWVAQKKTNKK